ncbi:hypothetical protein LTR15_006303 [Elasticomyces elasticus]|nr:hypothetical protein LTR15_006303 [Elasticomyces elasticus]
MVPAPIVGRYKLYKAGTKELLRWLANTASSCCDTQRSPDQPIKLSTRDLIALAKAIASADPAIGIPSNITELAEKVIAGRQHCADWYAAQPSTTDKTLVEDNEKHAHFITTLKVVASLLHETAAKSHGVQATPTPTPLRPTAASTHDLTNLFALLEVEEPSDEPLGEAPSTPSADTKTATKTPPTFEFEVEQNRDTAFEIWCVLQDLHDVRIFVRDTWLEYGRGEVSLLAAGAVTDTAFGIMRRATAELTVQHPRFKNYWQVPDYLGMLMMFNGDLIFMTPVEPDRSHTKPSSNINPAALLCPSAGLLLRQFGVELGKILSKASSKQSQSMDFLASQFPAHAFGGVLFKYYSRIMKHVAHTYKQRRRGEQCDDQADEFLKGLINYCLDLDAGMPIWLVVACQTYMEIFDILGKNTTCGADALFEYQRQNSASIRRYNELRAASSFGCLQPVWQDHFDAVVSQGTVFAERISKLTQSDVAAHAMLLQQPPFGHMPLEIILDMPAMPCQMLHSLKLQNLQYGALLCNDGFIVLGLAHVYAAARQHGMITTAWADMDAVIAQSSNSQVFVPASDKNASADAIARHFQSAMGVQTSTLSGPGLTKLPPLKTVVERARRVEVNSVFITSMMKHTQEQRKAGKSTDAVIDHVLHALTSIDGAEKGVADVNQTSEHSAAVGKQHSPLVLLDTFKKHFTDGEAQMNFDYIEFFQLCAKLMRSIATSVRTQLPLEINITQDYELVDWLLREAADAVLRGQTLDTTLFAVAATEMRTLIEKEGSKLTQAALEQSSGHISDQLKPDLAGYRQYNNRCRELLKSKGLKFESDRKGAAVYSEHGGMELGILTLNVGQELDKWYASGNFGAIIQIDAKMARIHGQARWEEAFALASLASGVERMLPRNCDGTS